jgi:hypothetical protein
MLDADQVGAGQHWMLNDAVQWNERDNAKLA